MPPAKPSKSAVEVHKFGGASLADAVAIRHAVSLLRERRGPMAVVVSAMAGVTDQLLDAARTARQGDVTQAARIAVDLRKRHVATVKAVVPAGTSRSELLQFIIAQLDELDSLLKGLAILRELTVRTSDFVVARGERLSARIVTAALASTGRDARYIDAMELVRTDGHFGNASPDLEATDRAIQRTLKPLLAKGVIPIVPGFIGAAPGGEVATLGRGGSDLTAALLGRALGAERVSLWKDVPGLLTADPRVVSDARVLPQLNVREAAELAYYGAKVLHPRALIPIIGRKVPLFVRPFADPSASGTEVSERETGLEVPVKALSATSGQALVTVEGNGMLGVPGVAARTFTALMREQISVSLISQASSEHSICFAVPEASGERAKRCLEEAFREEIVQHDIDGVVLRPGIAMLAIVGLGMHGTPGVAARVFSALSANNINVIAIAQGSSELNISVVVEGTQSAEAQRAIHTAFQLSKKGGGSVAPQDRLDVFVLGFGRIGRAFADMIANLPERGPAVRLVGVADRGGYVFTPEGLSTHGLAALARHKTNGRSIRDFPGGHRARADTAVEAVEAVGKHALSHPVLVDLTADETGPVLRRAIELGMHVVLANKRPLAAPGREVDSLRALASERDRRLLYEATVGAGLPVMDSFAKLEETGDHILRIEGCLSGTLGFLLDEIGRGRRFSAALRDAMAKGFTEPDPRDDLSGADVGRKALILGRLLGYRGDMNTVRVESLVPAQAKSLALKVYLQRLESFDAEWERRSAEARKSGGALRYVASVTKRAIKVGLIVVPAENPFAALHGTDNQVVFFTERYRTNPLVITGPGAGPAVTAAGVLNDVLSLARR